jgi:hypothetical protein
VEADRVRPTTRVPSSYDSVLSGPWARNCWCMFTAHGSTDIKVTLQAFAEAVRSVQP